MSNTSGDGIRALVIGDPHLRVKYIRVVDDFIHQTIELTESQKPHFVVVLGDTLHHHEQAHEACHRRAVEWFKAIAKLTQLYVLIGNHDRPNNSHFLTSDHFFNGLKGHKNIVIVDKLHSMEAQMHGKKFRFVFVPYVPPGRFQDALDTLDVSIADDPPKAIFAHQEFRGVKMGAIESEVGDEWPSSNPFVITGHIHEHQTVGKNILYVGTPYQTTFAEANNKGVFIFSFGGDQGDSAKRIRLKLRVKQKVVLQASEVKGWTIPNADDPDNNLMDLRVEIHGKKEDLEAVKFQATFKTLQKLPWVKIVLRPTFTNETSDFQRQDLTKTSYMEVLFKNIQNDSEMKKLYTELLGDMQ